MRSREHTPDRQTKRVRVTDPVPALAHPRPSTALSDEDDSTLRDSQATSARPNFMSEHINHEASGYNPSSSPSLPSSASTVSSSGSSLLSPALSSSSSSHTSLSSEVPVDPSDPFSLVEDAPVSIPLLAESSILSPLDLIASRAGGLTRAPQTSVPALHQVTSDNSVSRGSQPLRPAGISSAVNPFASSLARDALLTYAYRLYEAPQQQFPTFLHHPNHLRSESPSRQDVYRSQLLPLLANLHSLHPGHLPTMLLQACVYHALGDFETSLSINDEILRMDPHYAEAMCNKGTTLKALSRFHEAYQWWWKALELRPTYWDSLDNILHVVLSSNIQLEDVNFPPNARTRYRKALQVTDYVLSRIIAPNGCLQTSVPPAYMHRLQNVFYTNATLRHLLGEKDIPALGGAIELVFRPPEPYSEAERYDLRDIILSAYIAGLMASSNPGSQLGALDGIRTSDGRPLSSLFEAGSSPLRVVRSQGARLITRIAPSGELPILLLSPEQALRLSMSLCSDSMGVLRGICTREETEAVLQLPPEHVRQQCHSMTCTILLGVAKRMQDATPLEIQGLESISSTCTIVLVLYYLALSLAPSPAIYNNLGLVLAALPESTPIPTDTPTPASTTMQMARAYYEKGLQLDKNHPHLLSNLGSLLKDAGHVQEAISLYTRAIQHKPDFDIALTNLGNATKDLGRPWEAVSYYRRALEINPGLVEAACGLTASLTAICDWRGRGGISPDVKIMEDGKLVEDNDTRCPGWIPDLIDACDRQLLQAYSHNVGTVAATYTLDEWLALAQRARGAPFTDEVRRQWRKSLGRFYADSRDPDSCINEAGFVIRMIEWLQRRIQRKWYVEGYGKVHSSDGPPRPLLRRERSSFNRPRIPPSMVVPSTPSVLPFHTFASPLSLRHIRLISHRHALRQSHLALTKPWLPTHVYPPPPPPFRSRLNIGYVSADIKDHPLAHLMQSVFGLHDRKRFKVFVYATTPSDQSSFRRKVEIESHEFRDVSSWPMRAILDRIVQDHIHILINLGGYTKGSRNDIFAARPSPIQMSLMGFAGTLGAGWCDYLVCDPRACPKELCASEQWRKFVTESANATEAHVDEDLVVDFDASPDPESRSTTWMYTEKLLYMPHTYLVTDHKQYHREDEGLSPSQRAATSPTLLWKNELQRRAQLRDMQFPDIETDVVIFANFNQLYKICPSAFAMWLRILQRVPKSILWLLRFPAAGQENLMRTARSWGGDEIASRIHFTDIAEKKMHVRRCRVADVFLDTTEVNAHTVAADALWAGTPLVTWPKHRHKMCSRVASSIAYATGFGADMVVGSASEYEERAVFLANSLLAQTTASRRGHTTGMSDQGALLNLRRNIFLNRDRMPLFDTSRWTRNFEKGLREAWNRWVDGTEFEGSEDWQSSNAVDRETGFIWVSDDDAESIIQRL